MTTFEKLAIRLKKDIGYDLVDFKRTYAGIHMKGNGAFVWVANIEGSNVQISSTKTATELLKKKESIYIMENATISQLWEVL